MKRTFLFFLLFPSIYAQTPFSSDSVLSYLHTISVRIGARPMGSPNERQAMEFALAKFREFGLDESYIMEMQIAETDKVNSSINTKSGIAIGTLHGKSDRIIVIGGHIDSASPFIPGANDNGSGSATVIELARILSKEDHQSTLVFCLFGGEEAGLCGSKYFVQNYPMIDSVVLMLQLDMANGSDLLIPLVDNKSGNTPAWLVQATFEEFIKLNYSGLYYPTHFITAMSVITGDGFNSDYKPFLEINIPAIGISSDMNDPIHTPQDDFDHFKQSGLKRSGDLVYALVHRYDTGQPEKKTEKYYLAQLGGHLLFFPLWSLTGFIIFSVFFAITVFFITRKRRIKTDRDHHPKLPALKLFLIGLFFQIFLLSFINIIGLIKGARYPWIANPEGYFLFGFFAALLGIALSLTFAPRMNLSRDPYRWFMRSVILFFVIIFFMSLINVKLTIYPSAGLFFIALAMLVHKPWLKLLLWFISPHFMFSLVFPEGLIFIGRYIALHSMHSNSAYIISQWVFILLVAFFSFPFLLGFAAVYFDSRVDLLWLRRWRKPAGLAIFSAPFLSCAIILIFFPSYSDNWRQNILLHQSVDLKTREGKIILKSNDYLKHLTAHLADKDTNISTWNNELLLKEFTADSTSWIKIERTENFTSDSNTTFNMLIQVYFKYRPLSFTLSYSAGKNKIEDIAGPYITEITEKGFSLYWASFPDTILFIPIHFKVIKADSVLENIEVKFVELIEPMQIEKKLANIFPETVLRQTDVIRGINKK